MTILLEHFAQKLESFCKTHPKSIVYPEAGDARVASACKYLFQQKSVKKILLSIPRAQFIQAHGKKELEIWEKNAYPFAFVEEEFPDLNENTRKFLETLNGSKKNPLADCAEKSKDPMYQSCYLLSQKRIDVLVSGACYTTAEVIKAGLFTLGLKPGIKRVSSCFLMTKDGISPQANIEYIFADCAVNIDPNTEELVDIAHQSYAFYQAVKSIEAKKQDPKVVFLSCSTKGSAKSPSITKMREAWELFREKHPKVASDGEVQFDAAVDPDVCKRKSPDSSIAGDANIFIFPNLDAGNLGYKITQRLGGFNAYGPVLLGFQFPLSDLSRGATTKDIIVTTYLNSLRSEHF